MSEDKKYHKKGMRYPPLNDLISRAHNKYELVLATAKRAREIVDGKEPLIPIEVDNPISIATDEIEFDYIKLKNPSLSKKDKSQQKVNPLVVVDENDSQIVKVQDDEDLLLAPIEDS